jgi:hypothetical protein
MTGFFLARVIRHQRFIHELFHLGVSSNQSKLNGVLYASAAASVNVSYPVKPSGIAIHVKMNGNADERSEHIHDRTDTL